MKSSTGQELLLTKFGEIIKIRRRRGFLGCQKFSLKFLSIKETYEKFYTDMMRKGSFPLRKTEFGYWGYSSLKDVFAIFKKIKLENYKNFIDLGSGDGKVVLLASLFTNAVGFELDKNLYKQSVKFTKKLNTKKLQSNFLCPRNAKHSCEINNVKFYNKNYFNEDLSKYDVIYHYPDQPIHKIENKLLNELSKKSIFIHYGNYFLPLQLKKLKEFDFKGMKARIYKI